MPEADPLRVIVDAIRASALVGPDDSGVVMVSGGPDSGCLLTGLAEMVGARSLVALHVNYGLRAEADADQAVVSRLCERLGVELEVVRAGTPGGNVQAWARQVRHREAERIRSERGFAWIAIGHNRSDQAETFLYRLASSPGSRSLLAMPSRSGNLIRPLIGISGHRVREAATQLLPEFAEDGSNQDPGYARNRIRHEVMPALELINPAAELNIVRTRAELESDEDLLLQLAREALLEFGAGESGPVPVELLERHHRAVQRRILRQVAEAAFDEPVTISARTAEEVVRLAGSPEGGEAEFPGGRFLIESGEVRVVPAGIADPDPRVPGATPVPVGSGSVRFGDWTIEAALIGPDEARSEFGAQWSAFFDADELSARDVRVRARESGDRIDQLGMPGSRSLQDVFTDRRSPRSKRPRWPVIEAAGTVLWVPGLAVSDHFLVTGRTRRVLRLHAVPPFPI